MLSDEAGKLADERRMIKTKGLQSEKVRRSTKTRLAEFSGKLGKVNRVSLKRNGERLRHILLPITPKIFIRL